jgi:hypothetical protein
MARRDLAKRVSIFGWAQRPTFTESPLRFIASPRGFRARTFSGRGVLPAIADALLLNRPLSSALTEIARNALIYLSAAPLRVDSRAHPAEPLVRDV